GQVACWGFLGSNATLRPVTATGLDHVAGVAAGGRETCAWRDDGTATCWRHGAPYQALGGIAHVVEVAGDEQVWCARSADGHAGCWVRDPADTAPPAPVATPIAGLTDAVELAVAGPTACVRRATGEVACWSISATPGVGVTATRRGTVAAARGATTLMGGGERFAAVTPGGVVAWSDSLTPETLPPLPADTTRVAIAARGGCAIGRTVTCFDADHPPHEIEGLAGAREVVIGDDTVSCARTADGHAACWGYINRLGAGEDLATPDPVLVLGIADAVEIAADDTTCARRASGHVACWGMRYYADPKDRDKVPLPVATRPYEVPGITNAVALEVERDRGCAKLASGKTACWDWTAPRTGDGWRAPTIYARPPREMTVLRGEPRSWGGSVYRQSESCTRHGRGVRCEVHFAGRHGEPDVPEPDPVLAGIPDIVDLQLPDSGSAGAYVVRGDGQVLFIDDGFGAGEATPIAVGDATALAAGAWLTGLGTQSCALRKTGAVACWVDPRNDPTIRELPGIRDAVQLVGHVGTHSCARLKAGQVMCWGERDHLGDGAGIIVDRPRTVAGVAL
ncbi:MAG TPA: hypothetical protein VLX92_12440, partial [Kofleriaceae bacterium]|nr:hypothetical protein [Kofleriaceae bacterium]